MKRTHTFTVLALICLLSTAAASRAADDNWPRFRGPSGAGISHQTGLPVKWSGGDYEWKTPLPGIGHSSPCVWGDHLFLTTAVDEGRKRQLLDIDTTSGRIRWAKETASKTHTAHAQNSYASATPATDGKHVFVLFASDEQVLLQAYDFEGTKLWQRDLGAFHQKDGQVHGSGTSPIVFQDTVILANQQDGPSSIVALDAATGDVRWASKRPQLRMTAHSTPLIVRLGERPPQLFFTNSGEGISSLDPATGKLLFTADLMNARCVGSPVVAGNVVLATSGGGGRGKSLAAIPISGRGTLEKEDAAWSLERNLPYVPTPIAYGGHVYLWGDSGVVVCVKQSTGEEVWTERVGGSYSGSPICIDGKLYCISMDGEVVVIAASPKYELLGRTKLGELCRSTPAVSGGRLFLRGSQHLFCLKATAVE